MSAHDENPAAKATALVGAVTHRAVSTASRLVFAGVSTGLQALGHANSVHKRIRRSADTALQVAAMTPLGRLLPEPSFDDDADVEGQRIAHPPAERPRAHPMVVPEAPADEEPTADVPPEDIPAEMTEAARQVGAPGAATAEAEAAVAKIAATEDIPTEPTRDELPIPDFDNVTVPSLRSRLRSLSLEDLVILREYEQAHAHRLPVVTMLDNRIAKLAAAQDSPT